MNRKKIIINADDLGMHPEVDHAIAELAEKGIVTSASMMSLGSPDAEALDAVVDCGIDLGLHLDFTSSFANQRYGTSYTVKSLIVAAWRHRLNLVHVRHAISEQLERFEEAVGAPPDFVDGHEHVHQFPVIRETLLDILQRRYPDHRMFIRNTVPSSWRGTKAAIIGALGARETRRQAGAYGYRCNSDFGGVYDFSPKTDLYSLWSAWLKTIRTDGSLVMCHPARSVIRGDAIAAARVREFSFLASDECAALFRMHQVHITGWDEALT